jgi:pyroglutamyl-peptidase
MDDDATSRGVHRRAGKPRSLLVFGFGPFEDCTRNVSADVTELVDGANIAGIRVVGRQLETSWRHAWPTIRDAVENVRPEALLVLGAAPDPFVRLENVTRNFAARSPDILGELPPALHAQQIVESGPALYRSTLPLMWILDGLAGRRARLASRGGVRITDVRMWDDAGPYVCNYVFYRAMHELGRHVPHRGLIHIPRYDSPSHEIPSPSEILACGADIVALLSRWIASAP